MDILTVKLSNYSFTQLRVHVLGHIEGTSDIHAELSMVDVISKFEKLKKQKGLRSFLRLDGYYDHFNKGSTDLSAALHPATSMKENVISGMKK